MQQFEQMLEEKGMTLSPQQIKQFHTYFHNLVEWNKKVNLTAITTEHAVYLKHFYDSLSLSFFYDFTSPISICDVGAGAGFPSIPLKIVFPELKITIVDALQKRITFLENLVESLNLDNVTLFHDRAETFGHQENIRESFDVVTARAVARLNILSEYCLPLVKIDGTFLAMKGASGEEEAKEAGPAIQKLGGQVERVEPLQLPEEKSHRHLIFVKKVQPTDPKYPRKPGMPNKQPL